MNKEDINEKLDKILNIKHNYNGLLEIDSDVHPLIKDYKNAIKLLGEGVIKLIKHKKICQETKCIISFNELNRFSNINLFDLMDAITEEKIRIMDPLDVLRDVLYYLESIDYDISNFHISRCFCLNHYGCYLYELNWNRLKTNYNRDYIFYKDVESKTNQLPFKLTDKVVRKLGIILFWSVFIMVLLYYFLRVALN